MSDGHVYWHVKNPWRKYCDRWWLHWLKLPVRLLWDIGDAWQRSRRGWAKGDIYDLCSYHAGLTRGIMEHYLKHHYGYCTETPEEYTAKLQTIVDGWKAMEDFLGPDGCLMSIDDEKAWRKELWEKWEKGMKEFTEFYPSFWQ